MFRCGMIPVIIKPTRVTTHTAAAIDPMFTNSIINTEIKSAIIKVDISDHDDIKIFDSVNNSYDRFPQIFLSLYNECFPKVKIKLKPQKHFRPWITLGIRNSSERKQRL